MEITGLRARPEMAADTRLSRLYAQLQTLLVALRSRDLPQDVIGQINRELQAVNAAPDASRSLKGVVWKGQQRIARLLEQNLKIVPRNYYRNQWMALGIPAFGIPIGVAFGTLARNMALIGTGMPIGMAIGTAVGSAKDRKALREGRQIDVELKP